MKAMILTLIATLGMAAVVSAQKNDTVTLRAGQQKKAAAGDITIKFVSVVEDSRPDPRSMQVRAGNAKIEIKISDRHGSMTAIVNTTMGPKGDQYGGYAINLISLAPQRTGGAKIKPSSYQAVFSVTRLQR